MNMDVVIDALGGIDDRMVQEVETLRRKRGKPMWIRWTAIAACFALIATVGLYMLVRRVLPDDPKAGLIYVNNCCYEPDKDLSRTTSQENVGKLVGFISWDGEVRTEIRAYSYINNDEKTNKIVVIYNESYYVYSFHSFVPEDIDEKDSYQKMAVDANEALMQYFLDNGWMHEYPEYFGGCYIADNILHVRLVSPSEQTMETLKSIFRPYAKAVVYESCDFSQTAAKAYADEIANELLELGYAVTHWYVDSTSGNVIFGVLADDMEAVSAIISNRQENSFGKVLPKTIIEEGWYTATEELRRQS